MQNIEKIKNVYKTIVKSFLKTNDAFSYWECIKALNDFIDLFPEIDFMSLNDDIRKILYEEDKIVNNYNGTIKNKNPKRRKQ